MVELVVLACLIAQPQSCEEFHVPFVRQSLIADCTTKQPSLEVFQWAREHPEWTIKRWTCGAPRA